MNKRNIFGDLYFGEEFLRIPTDYDMADIFSSDRDTVSLETLDDINPDYYDDL